MFERWCSNRTFMELKCDVSRQNVSSESGSDRTFMELKY